ncbi:hypothetical protein AgCh_040271 [Apium graveolens]
MSQYHDESSYDGERSEEGSDRDYDQHEPYVPTAMNRPTPNNGGQPPVLISNTDLMEQLYRMGDALNGFDSRLSTVERHKTRGRLRQNHLVHISRKAPIMEGDALSMKSRSRGRALGLYGWTSSVDILKVIRRFPVGFLLGPRDKKSKPIREQRPENTDQRTRTREKTTKSLEERTQNTITEHEHAGRYRVAKSFLPTTIMNLEDVHPSPVNHCLLHLQASHRSLDIWRLGSGDILKCRRKNPINQDDLPPLDLPLVERWRPETHPFHLPMEEVTITLQDVGVFLGLLADGDVVISDVTPGPGMSWTSYVGEILGSTPDPKKDMNGSRVRLTFIFSCTPPYLPQDASTDDIRFQVLCYLVHLFGGVLFTDHSRGRFHPMFLHFLRDLDRCGDYV